MERLLSHRRAGPTGRASMSVIALLLGAVLLACGGGSDAAGNGTGSGNGSGTGTTPQNPCTATADEADTALTGSPASASITASAKRNLLDRSGRYRVLDALWLHQQQGARAIDAR